MAGHHSLQTHLPAGCNGASGPGSLDGLSPTLGVDIRSFRVSPAEEVRRRAELCVALERRIEELPPLAREPLSAYFHSLGRRNYALNTLRGYVGVLRGFALALPVVGDAGWASVSPPDVHRFIEAEQAQGRRASTINVKLKILHGFYAFLTDQGLASTNPVKRSAYLKMPEALPRPMAAEDTRRFVAALEEVRERAIFLVLLRTGMRIGELLAARVQDVDLAESSFTIPKGKKNRRGRVVYLSPEAHRALAAWLHLQWGEPTDPFFPGRLGRPLSYNAVRKRFKAALEKAGITRDYGLHGLRHTFAVSLLDQCVDLRTVQDLLGHSNITTTQRYLHTSDEKKLAAVNALSFES